MSNNIKTMCLAAAVGADTNARQGRRKPSDRQRDGARTGRDPPSTRTPQAFDSENNNNNNSNSNNNNSSNSSSSSSSSSNSNNNSSNNNNNTKNNVIATRYARTGGELSAEGLDAGDQRQ